MSTGRGQLGEIAMGRNNGVRWKIPELPIVAIGTSFAQPDFWIKTSVIRNTNLVGSDPHVTRNGATTFHSVCTEVIKLSYDRVITSVQTE